MTVKRKAVVVLKKERTEKEYREPKEDNAEPEEGDAAQEDAETTEDALAAREDETKVSRKKELKAMSVDVVKTLATKAGLDFGKKNDMIHAIIEHEAEQRANARAREAQIRDVVVKKKGELEAMAVNDLKELCSSKGITGVLAKTARVEQLLRIWQEEDGVEKAMKQMLRDARAKELENTDIEVLQRLCDQAGVEALIKEVTIDRVLRQESVQGHFAHPMPPKQAEEVRTGKPTEDIVENLLAHESTRKKERELRKQQEEKLESKRQELRTCTLDELKKRLQKKGHEPSGKKEDMADALTRLFVQEEEFAAKRNKLKALELEELKKVAISNGLQADRNKEKMVGALMELESQFREASRTHSEKVVGATAMKKEELDSKTGAELRDLCSAKGLKPGSGKEDRLERLLQAAQSDVEIEKIVVDMKKAERQGELQAMTEPDLLKVCEKYGVDPYIRGILVERLLVHEDEFGRVAVAPASKKARKH